MSLAGKNHTPEATKPAPMLAVVGLLGQVGCLTLVIVLGSLGLGLWLDARMGTRPLFTLVLVVGTLPATIYLIYRIALRGITRLQQITQPSYEEGERGKNP